MNFSDIPQFPHSYYEVDVPWKQIEDNLVVYQEMGLDLDPDFQRGHVWTETQQRGFLEYSLRGGQSARHVYFNSPNWHQSRRPIQLIVGKQRLWALTMQRGPAGHPVTVRVTRDHAWLLADGTETRKLELEQLAGGFLSKAA